MGEGINSEAEELDIEKPKCTGPSHTLLAKVDNDYKVVETQGLITKINEDELKNMIKLHKIANCKIIKSLLRKNRVELIAVYRIQKDEEFEKEITEKYNKFIAKTKMSGYSEVSFKYEIENDTVRLTKFKGYSKDVILPLS